VGEYTLTDETYKELVLKLKEKNFSHLNASLRKNILAFYHSNTVTGPGGPDGEERERFEEALASLRSIQVQ
jgi:hypothetical protein